MRWLVVVATTILLVGCGGESGSPNRATMLVYRSASGPVYRELTKSYRTDYFRGSQDVSRYALLVLDGASTAPLENEAIELVRSALSKSVPVMFVNASEGHKRSLMSSRCVPAHTKNDSAACLITRASSTSRVYELVDLRVRELPIVSSSKQLDQDGILTGQYGSSRLTLEVDGAHLSNYMATVRNRLQSGGRTVLPSPPSDYPSNGWFQVTVTENWEAANNNSIDGQSIGHQMSYTFAVYADSGSSIPSQRFQWCVASMDGTVSLSAPPAHDDVDQRGYAHTLFQANLQPVDTSTGNGLQLALVQAQPTAATGSYSSAMDFTIGYQGASGPSSWIWQQSLQQQLGGFGGWQATAPPPPASDVNDVSLQAMQTSPFDGDGSNWTDGYYRVFVGKHVTEMNPASISSMNVIGQALWKTFDPFSGTIDIDYGSTSTMMKLQVNNYFFKWHCYHFVFSFGPSPGTVSLDFSQAMPQGVAP